MRTRIFISLFTGMALFLKIATAQPLQINVAALPPFPPQAGTYFDNPSRFFNVAITNTSANNVNFWVGLRIEMTFPDRIVLETPLNMPPFRPVTIGAYQTMVLDQITFRQLLGHLDLNNLLTRGIRLDRFATGEGNLMPEGTYTACITAYEFNPNAGNPILASTPGTGCTNFTICYTASAPEFITPAACISMGAISPTRGIDPIFPGMAGNVVVPVNPLLISWRPPMFNCAGPPAQFTYNLKLVEVMPGQNVQSAIDYNPVAIQLNNMMASTAQIDTNMFANILRPGQQYAMQVTAMPTMRTSNIIMANQGKSPVCSFVWGSAPVLEMPPVAEVPEEPVEEPEPAEEPRPKPTVTYDITDCEPGLADNLSQQFFASNELSGQDITIGHFTMRVQQATLSGDHYQGNGYVTWIPFGSPINIKVNFENIKINEQFQVFDGEIYSAGEDLTVYVPDYIQRAYGWADDKLDQYKQQYGLNVPSYRAKVQGYYDLLKEPSRRLNQAMQGGPFTLPLAVNALNPATPIDIGIIGMVFTPTSAKMNTMAVFEVPETGHTSPWLAFVGQGMCFTPNSLLFEQQGTLFLAADFEVNMGGGNQLIFKMSSTLGDTSNGTFVQWNADGFELAGIDCDMKFSTGYLKADDGNGNIDPAKQVTASFRTQFSDWNDWIATASMEPFQVDGLPEFTFTPSNITYDNSKESNLGTGMVFPAKYETSEKTVAWQGFYIQNLSLQLPKDFTTFGSSAGNRLSVDVSNMLIDDFGVSCNINKTNIVSLTTGNLGGWAFSMDTLAIDILKNDFDRARVAGKITVPALDEDLNYAGFLTTDTNNKLDYGFAIKPENNIEMGMWLAKLKIDKNSGLEIKKDVNGAAVSLLMNGQINIANVSHGPIDFSFDSIRFVNLGIANRDPFSNDETFYLDEGTWSFGSPQKKIGPFDFALDSVYFQKKQNTYYGLGLKGKMTIAEVFTGTVSVDVDGEVTLHSGLKAPTTSFAGVSVSEIGIKGNFNPVSVEGTFTFFKNDPVYGRGVRGNVSATFDPLFDVEALAMFGSFSGYTYWMVDAGVAFNPPIEAFPLAFGGFGGGIRYNMKAEQFANDPADQFDGQKTLLSHSGVRYVPEKDAFGLRAGVTLTLSNGLGGGNVFNGTAWIDCQWVESRFSALKISGETYAITDYPGNKNALVQAPFEIIFDNYNSELSFFIKPQASFLGASVVVPVNFWANYNTKKWYFTIGLPHGDRIEAKILPHTEIGPIEFWLNANAYFALGNALNIELPQIPPIVAEFLNVSPRRANPKSLGGSGMMMGASLDGGFSFDLFVYCDLRVLAGFDVALSHIPGQQCNGRNMGYNGWYGMGQVYAYLHGALGLNINVWFFKGKVRLADLTAGALLMGGMPDPFWAYGTVRVKGSVLGGLIKISTVLEAEFGEVCVPDGYNPLDDIRILEMIQPGHEKIEPAQNSEPESVFIRPRVIANLNLSDGSQNPLYPIDLADPRSARETYRRYQFYIKEAMLYVGPNNTTVSDNNFDSNLLLQQSMDPTIVNLQDHRGKGYFDQNRMHKIMVVASAKQYYASENKWDFPTVDGERKEHFDSISSYFKTDAMPDDLSGQLATSWPFNGQRFVTPDDRTFMASIIADRDDILKEDAENRIEAWIARKSQETFNPDQQGGLTSYVKRVPFSTSSTSYGNLLLFNVNRSELQPEHFYELSIVRINKAKEEEAFQKLAQENRRLVIRDLLNNTSARYQLEKSNMPSSLANENLQTEQENQLQNLATNISINSGISQTLQTTSTTGISTVMQVSSAQPLTVFPPGSLQSQTAYQENIVSSLSTTPSLVAGAGYTPPDLDEQISSMFREVLESHVSQYGQDTVLDIRQMAFLNTLRNDYVDTIMVIFFRTSKFRTISQKIAAFGSLSQPGSKNQGHRVSRFASEPFEHIDINGLSQADAMALGYQSALPPIYNFGVDYMAQTNQHKLWMDHFSDGIHRISDILEEGAFQPYRNLDVTDPDELKVNFGDQYNRQTTQFPIRPVGNRRALDYWPGHRQHLFYWDQSCGCPTMPYSSFPGPVKRNELNDSKMGRCRDMKIHMYADISDRIKRDYNAYRIFKQRFYYFGTLFNDIGYGPQGFPYSSRHFQAVRWVNDRIKILNTDPHLTNLSLPIEHLLRMAWGIEPQTYSTQTGNSTVNGKSMAENQDIWNFMMEVPPPFPAVNIPNAYISVRNLIWDNSQGIYKYSEFPMSQKIPIFY